MNSCTADSTTHQKHKANHLGLKVAVFIHIAIIYIANV